MAKRHPISTGDKFGMLTIIEVGQGKDARVRALCECGQETSPLRGNVIQGRTVSCGCHGRSGMHRTHGMSETPTYIVWLNMRARCSNHKNPSFPRYGGRGISVCPRWDVFENFLADMGERPDGMKIERIDNNAGYSPKNCKWATDTEQIRNQGGSASWLVDGITFGSQREVAMHLGVSQSRVSQLVTAGDQRIQRKRKYL